ncbi:MULTISPECIES: TetR/AcrR family transcriptional regulator [Sphingobacterium]|uniref:TetR/AcrR family transcriptional regulator n=1 Tax=Sphingobacterium tenebrionis TaxID=3111775 RepID=A0ABU8I320_9SPHI|nr:TetR/AcrR family transcriptional regulator [Sphingobacterium sp. CZ-2]QBR11931.1 TetR/AcrR family transcriptional regulator [Sphingobacterium sp. CZ-2]
MKKQKQKEDLKVLILEAAKKLFVQQGYESTSIRKIAQEIGFSPTTIYLYYKDKNDLIYALHQVGFTMMRDRFMPLGVVEDPFERLKAVGKNYIEFALDHPEYYEVMFMMKEPMDFLDQQCGSEQWQEGERVLEFLKMTVAQCQQQGYFKGMTVEAVTMQAWAAVHGLVTLHVTQHLEKIIDVVGFQEGVKDMMYASFEAFVQMMGSTK